MSSAVQQGSHVPQSAIHFQYLDIALLYEAKHNPRQHFNAAGLEELAESIRKAGILTPLLVRPRPVKGLESGVEIAAGHRRYRAAKLAQLESIPCLVREMDDQTFMEILTVENLQREDVHPLDEAKGYEALMAAPYKMKVEALAQKVGKSVKYVYDRIKLLALTKPARDLFWSGMIEAGHAILLARLTSTEQTQVMGTPDHDYDNGGLFQAEHRLFLPDEEQGDEPHVKAVSVRELQAYIDQHIRFTVRHVDPMLFPETVAQVTNATEMKRKIIEITHEYLAGDDVRHADKAKVYGERAWARADGQEDSKVCDFAVLGVLASGPGRGQAFEVCIRKDKCLVHWGKEIRAREKRQKDQEKGNTSAVSKADAKAEKQRQADQQREERRRQKQDHWEKVAPKITAAVLERVKTLPVKADGFLGDLLVKVVTAWNGRIPLGIPRGKTADDLVRHLGAIVLARHVRAYNAHEQFPPMARAMGVDLSPFIKEEPHTSAQKKKGRAA